MAAVARRTVTLVAAVVLLSGLTGSARGQEEMTGVRAMGMGEAFTGGPSGSGSLYFNPAGVSSLMMYSVETSYVYDQLTGRNLLHASIVDGATPPEGSVFFYLNRPLTPFAGSWGQTSSGAERPVGSGLEMQHS